MMYQRILIPVDTSETSKLAMIEAEHFAHNKQAILRLAHVIDLAQFSWGANEVADLAHLQQGLREAGQLILSNLATLLNTQHGIKAETTLIEIWGGSLVKGIIDEANHWGADLIIMGTHGYSGLTHLLLGSVAEGVMRGTNIPILLVRNKAEKSHKDKPESNDTDTAI